jgi:hypothetical protein
MLTANTNLKFTHPSLLKSTATSVGFDELEPKDPQSAYPPNLAIDRLVKGNHKFVEQRGQRQANSIRLSAVAQGQKPFAAVLNYAQLDTSIEEVFGQKFGELFVMNSPGLAPSKTELPQKTPRFRWFIWWNRTRPGDDLLWLLLQEVKLLPNKSKVEHTNTL